MRRSDLQRCKSRCCGRFGSAPLALGLLLSCRTGMSYGVSVTTLMRLQLAAGQGLVSASRDTMVLSSVSCYCLVRAHERCNQPSKAPANTYFVRARAVHAHVRCLLRRTGHERLCLYYGTCSLVPYAAPMACPFCFACLLREGGLPASWA